MGQKGYDASCARISYEQTDPVLLIYTGRCLEAVRWAPSDGNLVAAVASDDASVQLFDLQYTKVRSVSNRHPRPCTMESLTHQVLCGRLCAIMSRESGI